MDDYNPDHYKYMPHSGDEPESGGETTPQELHAEATFADVKERIVEISVVREKPEESETREETAVDFPAISKNALVSIIYNILSPLIIPTVATLFIFLLSLLAIMAPGAAVPYTLTVFGATFLLPVLLIFILQKTGIVRSFQLYDRNDRVIPYVLEFLALGAMAIFFIVKGGSPWIWRIFCGGAAISLTNLVVNFRVRISNHCSAIAALLAVIIVIQIYGLPQRSLFWWAVGTTLFCGFIGTLAILKGRHTLWEVLLGYATGFLGIVLFSLIL